MGKRLEDLLEKAILNELRDLLGQIIEEVGYKLNAY